MLKADAADILEKAEHLLQTERIVQEKIKSGATIGQLINVDEVFNSVFSYHKRAVEKSKASANAKAATSRKLAGHR